MLATLGLVDLSLLSCFLILVASGLLDLSVRGACVWEFCLEVGVEVPTLVLLARDLFEFKRFNMGFEVSLLARVMLSLERWNE